MYKFIRYKYREHLTTKEVISQWMFTPQTEKDVFDFFYKYTMSQAENHKLHLIETVSNPKNRSLAEGINGIKLGWKDPYVLHNGHPNNNWDNVHQYFMELIDDKYASEEVAIGMYDIIASKMLLSRLDTFKKGIPMYFDKEAMVCRCLPDIDIVDTVEKEELVFPDDDYNIEQVKYIQWDGGKHWYAKIHNEDIVVDGEQKWNTKIEAEEAVKKFFRNNYEEKRN